MTVVSTSVYPDAEAGAMAGRAGRTARARLSSRVYLPAISVAVLAALLVGIGWSTHFDGTGLGAATASLRLVQAGPASLAIIGVFLVAERVRPAQRRPLIARGHRQDALFAIFNVALVLPLVAALTSSFSLVVRHAMPWVVLPKKTLAHWVAVALIVVTMDFCFWLAHLANHRIRALWRFHEVHHSQEDLNVLSVFRTHPLVHVSYLVASIPFIVLMANGSLTVGILVAYGAILAFAHSNTNLGFGPLGRILVSPNYHRIHHMLDGPQDVNLGFALTIWDQLFGRAVFPTQETIRTDTGLPGRPLIVEHAGVKPHHLTVFAVQLIAPFRPMNTRTDLPPVRPAGQAET